jgi:hypothetical protein
MKDEWVRILKRALEDYFNALFLLRETTEVFVIVGGRSAIITGYYRNTAFQVYKLHEL